MSPLPQSASPSQPSIGDSARYQLRETGSSPSSRSDRNRRQHKPIPSPLQQASYSSPAFSTTSPTSHDQPRSPREILDHLIATEKDEVVPSAPSGQETPRGNRGSPNRTSVAPSVPLSPPTSPTSTGKITHTMASTTTAAQGRPGSRPVPPRNPSIDSAVSSISSSTSQSYHSTPIRSAQDTRAPPDMTSLILAAGSPEAALLSLWKERQSASNHNAQLWRLVEKQRTMILGLNKDLERALKDKERYRKKLKDHMAQAPPLPNTAQRSNMAHRDHSSSPANSDAADDLGHMRQTLHERSTKSALATAMSKANRAGSESPRGGPQVQSTHSPIQTSGSMSATDSAIGSHEPSPTDASIHQHARPIPGPNNGAVTGVHEGPRNPPKATGGRREDESLSPKTSSVGTSSTLHVQDPSNPPALSLTQATPIVEGGRFSNPIHERTGSATVRKAPPKPLDLSNKSVHPSSHLHAAGPTDGSESEYDDQLEVDEIPRFERGRRKTREEDDHLREAHLKQEQDSRSMSKKKVKSKSKSKSQPTSEQTSPVDTEKTTVVEAGSMSGFVGLPASPRAMQQSGSIAAVLSPGALSDRPAIQRSVISPPLMSPGLPVSPRPGDRPMNSPAPRMLHSNTLTSPPMSPRGANGIPLSPRAPRQPIPLPLASPLSVTSPHLARAEGYQVHQQPQPEQHGVAQASLAERLQVSQPQLAPTESENQLGRESALSGSQPPSPDNIYRGLVSDNYPGLLLQPNALPSIMIRVSSSRLRPSRHSMLLARPLEEDPVFILGIHARSDGRQLWRTEKTIASIPVFHMTLKDRLQASGIGSSGLDVKVPDRSLFAGHAPAKIDARRAAVDKYFESVLDTEMDEIAALMVCGFLSTDAIGADAEEASPGGFQPSDAGASASSASASTLTQTSSLSKGSGSRGRTGKEGYLTKRGKNFGGWKARYFVLEGPELKYYEMAGGAHLGTIKLMHAQIGKQSPQASSSSASGNSHQDDLDNQYRHAFLILEPKRKDPSNPVRHVLCAESDAERDAWVEALVSYVDPDDSENPKSPKDRDPNSARSAEFPLPGKQYRPGEAKSRGKDGVNPGEATTVQAVSYDATVPAEAPIRGGTPNFGYRDPNGHHVPGSPTMGGSFSHAQPMHPLISGPTNGSVIHNVGMWGNKAASSLSVKDKKRSIFGFRGRSSSDLVAQEQRPQPAPHVVFGIPLAEAAECSQPLGVDEYLPAVVYRSIEYLRAKGAADEEGLFRLSGSNIVIKGLRERYNTEGDVRLLEGEPYDVHAVASLLKLYLRELPVSILTRELHLDFLKALEIENRDQKIAIFNLLVHRLPKANYFLLAALLGFLLEIVSNSEVNKMNVRNVGIVFAPTLNIPATIISLFLTAYAAIFGAARTSEHEEFTLPAPTDTRELSVPSNQVDSLGIRSPRHQMFSDLPTPSYRQTFLGGNGNGPAHGGPAPAGYAPGNPGLSRMGPPQADTGFIPLHPSYDAPPPAVNYSTNEDGNQAAGYNPSQIMGGRDAKQRRRESSMLMMNTNVANQRHPSMQRLREDAGLVREESAFD
ncbi:hypothetical protein P152DRAFT_247884 [Eremomyces bilateralis CBS 781.70]|uniref:RhoGAP-domain-containing protein n=1 Tax=Eremomyces bilateralis CBS 781.70 TaxID=1392243 RepID=A0A6G1GB54_9PEZI|nr:uncharacterized protein P152DRAFT_247884 [Eremomyces bilateralis CBS 781.70]KAF1815166.1 hypothetical protein P152DRAFT_247884 [Eremomyces bilateralis CBS 781.70]